MVPWGKASRPRCNAGGRRGSFLAKRINPAIVDTTLISFGRVLVGGFIRLVNLRGPELAVD
jgi:hypothetical protein